MQVYRSCFYPVLFTTFTSRPFAQLVKSVDAVGMTVSDMDRSVEFFSKVLTFEKIFDVEVQAASTSNCKDCSGCACEWCA